MPITHYEVSRLIVRRAVMPRVREGGSALNRPMSPMETAQVPRPVDGRAPSVEPKLAKDATKRPEPVAKREPFIWSSAFWQAASRASVIGMFLLALCICLDLARGILAPIVSALVIGLMLGPLGRRAAAHKIPAWVFATFVLVVTIALLQAVLLVVASPVMDVINKAPGYGAQLMQKLDKMEEAYPLLQSLNATLTRGEGLQVGSLAAVIQPVLAFLSPALGQIVVFIAALFFLVLGHNGFRRSLVLASGDHDRRLRALRIVNDVELSLTCYIRTVSAINIALGVVTGLGAWALGMPMPLLWGVLACVANFIPYVGPAVIVAALFGVGLIVFPTLGHALLPPLLFVGMTTIEGHFITPNVVGRRFTAHPFAVFISLAFWTWLWGPIGAFLAMPFLLIGMAVLHHLLQSDEAGLPA